MANRLVGVIIGEYDDKLARYSSTIYPDVLKHEFSPCPEEEVLKYIITHGINTAGLVEQVNRRLADVNQTS